MPREKLRACEPSTLALTRSWGAAASRCEALLDGIWSRAVQELGSLMQRMAGVVLEESRAMSSPGAEVERLLEEAEAVTGPVAWPRVEALVTALVELYGEGLGRMLACSREAVRTSGDLDAILAGDELVASLLLLHDIHPHALEERIMAALQRVRTELPAAAPLVLVSVDEGIAKLRVAPGSDPTTRPPPTTIVAREIEREAPEIAGVEVESAAPSLPKPASAFVPVERLKRGARP